jgi:NAD(P)H-hydrate epimerase
MKILTAAEMREADRLAAEKFSVPSLQLMENAGTGIARFLRNRFTEIAHTPTVILCGKGNNGGDGLVVARVLKQVGCNPVVVLCADPEALHGDAKTNLARWRQTQGDTRLARDTAEWEKSRGLLADARIVVDALLGTGLTGPAEGLVAQVIRNVNGLARRATIVAVDIPSGMSSDSPATAGECVHAHLTLALAAPKVGEVLPPNAEHTGELAVIDIGIPAAVLDAIPGQQLEWTVPQDFRGLPLRRAPSSHKGNYGHALLIAGSRGKTGAAVLAALGSLRTGAGLTTVATPDAVLPIVAAPVPELMTVPLLSTDAGTIAAKNAEAGNYLAALDGKDVLAMGPGLTTHHDTVQFVHAVVKQCPLPLILDADALNAAPALGDRQSKFVAVTPHPGEMARLIGTTAQEVQAGRLQAARAFAEQAKAHVILKGFRTLICAPSGRVYVNGTGNPGMAKGGSGDVLTGMLAGLTAQLGTEAWELVLALGVYLHGLAGDLAAAEVGEHAMMATDLVRHIPGAFRRLLAAL